ncbi:hypothetical protein GE107_09180 [Cohnella sp. CFH 77786]|uniref:hypothetical protein n=1 Tax=Cohnella sp. CFH 77786 TaxID=2662265 RepID=UPI001C60C197|nr:hypothetical protein [Cohnella sp. CFH 77786]MBW5446230.1 hypothetical protein [Cohnella sp. CFH 77786]
MFQTYGTFHEELMMQYRQAEMNKRVRSGLYIREIISDPSNAQVHTGNRQSFWLKWFPGRRLNTSVK